MSWLARDSATLAAASAAASTTVRQTCTTMKRLLLLTSPGPAAFREVDASQGAITDDPPTIKLRLVSARRKLADARSRRAPPPFLRDQEVAESPEDPDDKELVCMGVLVSIYIYP